MKYQNTNFDIPVTIAGLDFRNPFFVASGPTTMTIDQLIRIEETGWAGASLKLTIDPAPYINRYPRYTYHEDQGILSFTAERRLTLEQGLRLMEEGRKRTKKLILFSNITYSGDKGTEGWVHMARKFEESGAHANELNMCCPNMSFNVELSCDEGCSTGPKTGASLGQNLDAVREIVRAIKAETAIPLFVKVTPEGGRQALIAEACFEAGADVVGTNANRLAIHHVNLDDPSVSEIMLQDEVSMQCMCNDWIHPLALRDVYEMRKLNGPDVQIIGTGGVTGWRTAAQMVLCGANLVGICAETLVSGFGFMPELIRGFREWLDTKNVETLEELTNSVPPAITPASELTIYPGVARIKNPDLVAPCVFDCPASVPAQGYISLIADGDFHGGFDLLTAGTPLMSICAYVCSHPCEEACTRGEKDEPLRIRDLKRFLIERAEKEGWQIPKITPEANGKSVAIVGSGPAGLSAARQLASAGYEVTVYEADNDAGGMLRWAIPEFRLPDGTLDREIDAIKSLGVVFQFSTRLGSDVSLEDLRARYDAVFLALGAQRSVSLGIEGEETNGVVTALDLLKHLCETLETFHGKRVAVLGGGFTAVDAARTAVRSGAAEVFMLYRRTKDEMPAAREEILEAEEEGVKIMYLVSPVRIAAENGTVTGITMASQVLASPDETAERRRPVGVQGAEFILPIDMVVVAVGQSVDPGKEDDLPFAPNGKVLAADADGCTEMEGVYAGGDALTGSSTIVDAIGAGKRAAARIDLDLRGEERVLKTIPVEDVADIENVLTRNGADPRTWRVPLLLRSPYQRAKDFLPYAPVLTESEAVEEAQRCYRCGCGEGCMICYDICKMFAYHKEREKVAIDDEKCVACNMCVLRCPNDNIEMVQTGTAGI